MDALGVASRFPPSEAPVAIFMVAAHQRDTRPLREVPHLTDHSHGIWAAIEQVAREDEVVIGAGRRALEELVQLLQAPVDIPDDDRTHAGLYVVALPDARHEIA